MDKKISPLLKLQEFDVERIKAEAQLANIPLEIKRVKGKIADYSAAYEEARTKLQGLEVQRKDLDNQLKSAEEKITKFKNQQLQVKKNEEYQALTKEIDREEQHISRLEDEEIAVLLEIDEEKVKLEERKKEFDEKKGLFDGEIKLLNERKGALEVQVKELLGKIEVSEKDVDIEYLRKYRSLEEQGKKAPLVVSLYAGKCNGCHLKVTADVNQRLNRGGEIVQCDNCSRILY